MLKLMLLRHAKSSWADSTLADHDRPLNNRGRRGAEAMGLYMASKGLVPARILCSTAQRTRETLELLSRGLTYEAQPEFLQDLYDFGDGDELIDIIRRQGGATSPLLVIGHNPAIEGAALSLAAPDESQERARMARKYPTSGLTVLTFDAESWDRIEPGTGQLVSFTVPADLGI